MKIAILLMVSIVIFFQKGGEIPDCNLRTVKQAFVPISFAQIAIDGRQQNVIFTRFIHNKVGIYAQEISRCVFYALDPVFLYKSIGLLGLALFLNYLYTIAARRYWILIFFSTAVPFTYFLGLPIVILILIYKIFAIFGFAFLLKLK